MKLLIGVPSLDYMHTEFVKSLTALVIRLKDEEVSFDVQIETGTLVYAARDKIACKAINEGYTHVLWFDADMVFTDDILDSLMFCGKQFVSGICHSRRKGYHSCLFKNLDLNHLERFEEYPREAFEIAGSGFGCVLIDVQILKDVQVHFGSCFLPMRSYGEDLAFCLRAKEMGYKLYAEPSARLGHIGHVTIYPEDHERWKVEIGDIQK